MRGLVIAAMLVVGAAGCKKTLHWKSVEDELTRNMYAHAPPGIQLDVKCPETAVEKDLKFRCHVTASDGSAADVEITLLDLAGSWKAMPIHDGER